MLTQRKHHILLLFILGLPGFLNFSCNRNPDNGKLILTEVPVGGSPIVPGQGSFISGARLVMLDPGSNKTELITSQFYSACSPDISWDGSIMLFSAQEKENDPWQIWEMNLKSREVRKVTSGDENCTDPVFLPTGNIVFSKSVEKGWALFSSRTDGQELKQLTFHPHDNFATTILADGRLITVTRQIYPEKNDPMLMVIRPDGTKGDLLHKGHSGCRFYGKVHESTDGRIYFIESDSLPGSDGHLISVSYNQPMNSMKFYSENIPGSFRCVMPVEPGKVMVSFRKDPAGTFSLYELDTEKEELGEILYSPEKKDIVDIAIVKPGIRPKKLPSEVDMGVKTGLLLCQDINFTGLGLDDPGQIKAKRIEITGVDSSMGIINVQKDGSFYLKIIADKPFQIRKLDDKGKEISHSAWIWLRPNERRGCIGCHENPELAPENNVPLSVKKDPVSVPVHISEIVEKEVELE